MTGEGTRTVMGMDPSHRSFGLAYRRVDGTLAAQRIRPPDTMRGLERLDFLREAVTKALDRNKPDVVAYEDYAMGVRTSNSIFGIGELGGVIKLLLYQRGIAILTVPPTSLKLFATGSGRRGDRKEEIAQYLLQVEGKRFPSSDENDAAALLRLGEAATNRRLLPRSRLHYQHRAIAGCTWL